LNSKKFRKLKDVREYRDNGLYKYTVGNEPLLEKAVDIKEEMRNNGYKDAFIVAFIDEKRVTLEEARKYTGNK